jgi:pilus assembly protein Flp/PilA
LHEQGIASGRPEDEERSVKRKISNWIAHFQRNTSGATAIEYALIASGIALAIITAVNSVGTSVGALFTTVSTSLK